MCLEFTNVFGTYIWHAQYPWPCQKGCPKWDLNLQLSELLTVWGHFPTGPHKLVGEGLQNIPICTTPPWLWGLDCLTEVEGFGWVGFVSIFQHHLENAINFCLSVCPLISKFGKGRKWLPSPDTYTTGPLPLTSPCDPNDQDKIAGERMLLKCRENLCHTQRLHDRREGSSMLRVFLKTKSLRRHVCVVVTLDIAAEAVTFSLTLSFHFFSLAPVSKSFCYNASNGTCSIRTRSPYRLHCQ